MSKRPPHYHVKQIARMLGYQEKDGLFVVGPHGDPLFIGGLSVELTRRIDRVDMIDLVHHVRTIFDVEIVLDRETCIIPMLGTFKASPHLHINIYHGISAYARWHRATLKAMQTQGA